MCVYIIIYIYISLSLYIYIYIHTYNIVAAVEPTLGLQGRPLERFTLGK